MIIAVRIKGAAGLSRGVRDTMKMLRLNAPNNCVLVPETSEYKGMLEKIKDAATYGEVDRQALLELLRKRLRLGNGRRVEGNMLKDITGFNSHDELADNLLQGKAKLSDFKQLQHTLRLSPPSKGFTSTKQHYPEGDLGYRGNAINSLLERMI